MVQTDLDSHSLSLSFKIILGCVKLTITTNHHTYLHTFQSNHTSLFINSKTPEIYYKSIIKVLMVHICNPITWEVEMGKSGAQDHP